MPTVVHRQPVVVSHPETQQFVAVKRGDEIPDGSALAKAYPWLFADEGEPLRAESVRIEQATAAPGEKRAARRS